VEKFPRQNVYTKKNLVSIDGKGKLRINITSISTRCGYFAGGENLNCVRNQVVGGPFAVDDDTPLRWCIPLMWVTFKTGRRPNSKCAWLHCSSYYESSATTIYNSKTNKKILSYLVVISSNTLAFLTYCHDILIYIGQTHWR
jgi:hypothetical protein